MKDKNQNYKVCPICGQEIKQSDYLETIIKDDKVRYLANLVTHYRHSHISSWNKCWGNYGHHYRNGWFGDYDEEKRKVNERAKRQIIRKATKHLISIGIVVEHFEMLQGTTEETLQVARKKLGASR